MKAVYNIALKAESLPIAQGVSPGLQMQNVK